MPGQNVLWLHLEELVQEQEALHEHFHIRRCHNDELALQGLENQWHDMLHGGLFRITHLRICGLYIARGDDPAQ